MRRLSKPASAVLALVAAGALAACVPGTSEVSSPAQPEVSSQLWADLTTLSADDMEGRGTGTPGGERARAYIVSRFEELGIAAPAMGRLQPFSAEGRSHEGRRTFNGVNVLGLIPGTRVGNRYIVVTAHYDHVGMYGGQIYNGADDNASGVATMLALAEELKSAIRPSTACCSWPSTARSGACWARSISSRRRRSRWNRSR